MAITWNTTAAPAPSTGGITWNNAQPAPAQPSAPAAPTLTQKIWAAVSGAGKQIGTQVNNAATDVYQGVNKIAAGGTPVQGAEAGLQVESGLASAITSPLAPLFAPVSNAIQRIATQPLASGVVKAPAIADIPAVRKFAGSPAGETTTRVAEDLARAGNVAGTITGVDDAVKTAPAVADKISSGAAALKENAEAPVLPAREAPSAPNDQAIVSSYMRAVKPSVAGKTSGGQLDAYNGDVVSAVKSIAENKLNLSFETDAGDTVEGRTPQTRGQLADAVSQTKQVLFDQYNALAQKATGQGVKIPLDNAGAALDEVVNSEALKITNPRAVQYAENLQARLKNPDGSYKAVDPDVAQEAIANWNSSLKAFYRNPTYETASNAAIDAGVVHQVRAALDEHINNATGEDYQAIKNQYGALSAIEKDVNKAAIAQAKQTGSNTSGLGKYVDVFSGGDMVSGLLSLNPALFAKGAAQEGISHFFQWFNSPDRAVGTMFKAAARK